MSESPNLASLIQRTSDCDKVIATRDHVLRLAEFEKGSSLSSHWAALRDRSVVLVVRDMAKAAAALIDLDGWARRIVLCPPDWDLKRVESAARIADANALVFDGDGCAPEIHIDQMAPCQLPLQELETPRQACCETEWILPTSGTTGPPKLVVHTLRTLMGAISHAPLQHWATFYDIRRYGGLQIFLRAINSSGSLHLGGSGESVGSLLRRFGAAGITRISGTPSHWRKVLMSREGGLIDPDYVRLSGEIADDAVLEGLRTLYPRARIEHAYASTEAGVVFAVDDERPGFPASWVDGHGPVRMKVVDGSLRVRSDRCALRFLGADAPLIADEDGFIDTGDIVDRRGDRLYFGGRRSGVINVGGAKVHPEEVEAILNAHPAVRASRVYARKSPVMGALVFAEIVLRDELKADAAAERGILDACKERLAAHMVPAGLRFVSDLPVTDGGKIVRHG